MKLRLEARCFRRHEQLFVDTSALGQCQRSQFEKGDGPVLPSGWQRGSGGDRPRDATALQLTLGVACSRALENWA
jgi:hypothetical protein